MSMEGRISETYRLTGQDFGRCPTVSFLEVSDLSSGGEPEWIRQLIDV